MSIFYIGVSRLSKIRNPDMQSENGRPVRFRLGFGFRGLGLRVLP